MALDLLTPSWVSKLRGPGSHPERPRHLRGQHLCMGPAPPSSRDPCLHWGTLQILPPSTLLEIFMDTPCPCRCPAGSPTQLSPSRSADSGVCHSFGVSAQTETLLGGSVVEARAGPGPSSGPVSLAAWGPWLPASAGPWRWWWQRGSALPGGPARLGHRSLPPEAPGPPAGRAPGLPWHGASLSQLRAPGAGPGPRGVRRARYPVSPEPHLLSRSPAISINPSCPD